MFKKLNFIKKKNEDFIIRIKIHWEDLSHLSSASCSGLKWTVTQRKSVDGSGGARGREWDGSDRSREREIPCSLTPTLFFSLSLCSVCGISRCSSKTPASRGWRQRFLTVSLLWERPRLSGSLHLWEDGRNTASPSKSFSSLLPSVLAFLMVEACWLKLLSTLKIPLSWSSRLFFCAGCQNCVRCD